MPTVLRRPRVAAVHTSFIPAGFPFALAIALLLAAPVHAQTTPAPTASAVASDPHLSVASVRLNDATRASKIIGAAVVNENNEAIGTVDDLMIVDHDRIAYVVVSVGGFLGIGSKLVAVPYDKLQPGTGNHLVWTGATKQSLNDMPNFTYGS